MLRLAEEEAAEMREVAQRDADEIREQATRDAQAIKADASREAEEHADRPHQGARRPPRRG